MILKSFTNLFIALISIFFLSQFCFAVEISKLNEATVAVNSRSGTDRELGLEQALSNVFIKNSGNLDVLNNPQVKRALENPNALLAQYGYFKKDDQLMLKGVFESRQITNILRKAELPVWGKQRPLVLLWLSQSLDGQREIVNDSSISELRSDFKQIASEKGLPLILPLMDLNDLMKVKETDIRGVFPSAVFDASKRYHADYFVLANMQNNTNGGIFYQFNLFSMDRNEHLQSLYSAQKNAESKQVAVDTMINDLTSYFAGQYAVADSGMDEGVYLSLDGVSQLSQLTRIEKNIRQLSAVKSIKLVEVSGSKVTFSLELYSTISDLQRQLRLENTIKPVIHNNGDYSGIENNELQSSQVVLHYTLH